MVLGYNLLIINDLENVMEKKSRYFISLQATS